MRYNTFQSRQLGNHLFYSRITHCNQVDISTTIYFLKIVGCLHAKQRGQQYGIVYLTAVHLYNIIIGISDSDTEVGSYIAGTYDYNILFHNTMLVAFRGLGWSK